jgi:hypothetical protein
MLSAVAVKFWFVAACFLQGCAAPVLVHSDVELPADRALVMFSVSTPGGAAPVHIAVGKDRALFSDLSTEEYVFSLDDAVGLRLNELHCFALPAGSVRIAVTRIGDFWEFSGGKIEQTFEAAEGGTYYLGILELTYAEDAETTGMVYANDRPPSAGTQPLAVDMTPLPSRTLAVASRVIDDESSVRALMRAQFPGREPGLVNCAGNWARARWGALRIEKSTRPIQMERQP